MSMDLFNWRDFQSLINGPETQPVKPCVVGRDAWPPDYFGIYLWRINQLKKLRADARYLEQAKAYYKTHRVEFILHWMDTFDPRRQQNRYIPLILFPRQAEFIHFLEDCLNDRESGLVEKCRDVGMTWCGVAFSVARFLFCANDAIGWGSRKENLVDKIGNPDSIFEKIRLTLRRLPVEFLPVGFDEKKHATFMRIINPENGSIIMGDAGDNIGRGGRTSIYFKDESAHYARPELIEAALADNTDCQIDISSVNGTGNVFHRRREAGETWNPDKKPARGVVRVFVVDWSDHPGKTQEWYDARKAKSVREGMQHIFAQEVDRNYSAAVQNVVVPAEWVNHCVDAHLKIKWIDERGNTRFGFTPDEIPNVFIGGLDVADDDNSGSDKNGLCIRQWIILRQSQEWGERDPGVSTRNVAAFGREFPSIDFQYDSIGLGVAVKAEYNRLIDEKIIDGKKIIFTPWNAASRALRPLDRVIKDDAESVLNKDFFENLKAQAWWSFRTRVYKTFRNITEGVIYPISELISLDSKNPLLIQLKTEISQAISKKSTSSLRMIVDKQPGSLKSPNIADAAVMACFPVNEGINYALVGSYR